jgi:hypothetical protein
VVIVHQVYQYNKPNECFLAGRHQVHKTIPMEVGHCFGGEVITPSCTGMNWNRQKLDTVEKINSTKNCLEKVLVNRTGGGMYKKMKVYLQVRK